MTPFYTVNPAAVLSRSNEIFFTMEEMTPEKKAALVSLLRTLTQALEGNAHAEEGYFDAADVKQQLNISDRTLYRWRQNGLIRYVKMGGKYFYPKRSIRQLRSRGKGRK